MNTINHWLAAVLVGEWAVPAIVLALAGLCAFVLWWNHARHHRGMTAALRGRIDALGPVLDAGTTAEAQARFADGFAAVDAALRARDGSAALIDAWQAYRDTIVDERAAPVEATARPDEFWLHLGDDTRVLAWWANLFVAFGLTFTFLGIIAALTATTDSLRGADTGHMSAALVTLLTLTAAKFWTSIAGVVGSIVLRWFDRRWHSATVRRLETITRAIERGTRFVPAPRVAVEQLRALHALPAGIGEAIGDGLRPLAAGMADIRTALEAFRGGSLDRFGNELGTALSRGAGAEMTGLAAALAGMAEGIRHVNDRLASTSGEASAQIAEAAHAFTLASERMARGFAALDERLGGAAAAIAAQSDAAREAGAARVAADRASYDAMAARNAEMLGRAADALEAATGRAAQGIGGAVDAAIGRSAEAGARGIADAFAAFGERFDRAGARLAATLDAAADRTETLAGAIERSAGATGGHAALLARAAADVADAAAPIAAAAGGIDAAIGRTGALLHAMEARGQGNEAAIRAIADSLRETGDAATRAWTSYRDRFEDVDEALATALDRIKGASAEHATALNEQVGRIDRALADAVDRLHAALDVIAGLATSLRGR